MSETRLVVRRGASNLLVQVGQLLALIGTTILLSRRTGAGGLGTYVLMGTIVSVANLVTSAGVPWAGIHHLGRKTHGVQRTVSTVVAAAIASAALSVVIVGSAYLLLEHSFFHGISHVQIAVTLAAIPFNTLTNALACVLLGLNRTLRFSLLNFVQVSATLAVLVVLAAGGVLTPTTALEAWLVGNVVSLSLGVTYVLREVAIVPRWNSDVLRDLAAFGLKGYVANTLMYFNYRLDSLLVNGFLGVASVGIYSIAVSMAELVWYVANAASTVLFPHISSVSREEADRLSPAAVRNVLAVSLGASAVMFLAGRVVIALAFGSRLEAAGTPLRLLLPGVLALSAAKVIASYLSGIGKPIYSTYLAGGSLVASVVLDLALIPRFGVAGAAIVSSVVYTSTTVASVAIFRHESQARFRDILLVRASDLASYRRLLRSRGSVAAPE